MHSIVLNSPEETLAFGAALARGFVRLLRVSPSKIQEGAALPALLLHGELGAGKTTFARGFVQALPHGDSAEVASPSFTLCHHYDTQPPVLHADLYRTPYSLPDEVDEILEDGHTITLLEWAEFLPLSHRPHAALDIHFEVCHSVRLAKVQACGDVATRLLENLDNISWTKT